jgi:hypothetical protein
MAGGHEIPSSNLGTPIVVTERELARAPFPRFSPSSVSVAARVIVFLGEGEAAIELKGLPDDATGADCDAALKKAAGHLVDCVGLMGVDNE